MGFWSKLGKGALKVGKVAAPIALGMTGVGLPAAMAVSAGLNAADKKVSGGSWGDALKAGAVGAGTAAMGAGAGKALGGFSSRIGGAAVQQGVPKGLESVGKQSLSSILGDYGSQAGGNFAREAVNSVANRALSPSSGWMDKIKTGMDMYQKARSAIGQGQQGFGQNARTQSFNPYMMDPRMQGMAGGRGGQMMPRSPGQGIMGGMGAAMPRMNQRAPNLAHPIMMGRQEALMNQPWRTPPINPDPSQQMPNIYPQMPPGIGPSYMPYPYGY